MSATVQVWVVEPDEEDGEVSAGLAKAAHPLLLLRAPSIPSTLQSACVSIVPGRWPPPPFLGTYASLPTLAADPGNRHSRWECHPGSEPAEQATGASGLFRAAGCLQRAARRSGGACPSPAEGCRGLAQLRTGRHMMRMLPRVSAAAAGRRVPVASQPRAAARRRAGPLPAPLCRCAWRLRRGAAPAGAWRRCEREPGLLCCCRCRWSLLRRPPPLPPVACPRLGINVLVHRLLLRHM